MSKFRIIEGSNVVSITDAQREVRLLEVETKKMDPSNKQIITWAHHFMRLGHPLLAQRQLCRLSSGYFDMMIYKDLYRAQAAYFTMHEREEAKHWYEYLKIVKSSTETFLDLNFPEKPAFFRFRHEFKRQNAF